MNKLFFAICFNLLFVNAVQAKISRITTQDNIKPQEQTVSNEVKKITTEELKSLIKDNFEKAIKVNPEDINRNFGYIPSVARQMREKENKKGVFQKIYEQAISRIENPTQNVENNVSEPIYQNTETQTQQEEWNNLSNIPFITAYLPPDYNSFNIPALEHIPYLMNSIEVMQNGLVKFEETIVVVANGEKITKGLIKILPLKIFNATGQSKNLDYSIINVQVNDTPVKYKLTSNNNNVFLSPETDYQLTPGVYTYKFEYLVDNLLWDYKDFYQLYWDVGSNGWNLVTDRLGASLALPQSEGLLQEQILLGSAQGLNYDAVDIYTNGPFAKAYIAKRPLFAGEGMHLIADIDKNILLPETRWQKIFRFLYSQGDVYLSLLGLIIVTLSFVVSWRYISKDKGLQKIPLNKSAMVIRYLLLNRFDIKSACGFLLELYRKNIIDIQQSGDTILLIKRTDNIKGLLAYEQKAIKQLFPTHETTFSVSKNNLLPLKRFAKYLEKGLKKQMIRFQLKLNTGYLLFSFAMLFLTELSVALFKINSPYVFGILALTTIGCFFAVSLWYFGNKKWMKFLAKLVSIDVIFMCLVAFSAVVNPLASIFLIITVVVIVIALQIYSKRLGLIKQYIQDVAKQKDYILQHRDNIVLGKDFLNYQAAIWAFDLENEFANSNKQEYNKLQIVKNIANCF